MNVLFIGYWSANDGLSISTIYPHIQILSEFEEIKKVVYVSLERNHQENYLIAESEKIVHIPLSIERGKSRLLNKIRTLLYVPSALIKIVDKYNIDLCIARSSLAGIFSYKVWKRRGVPFLVESFEPHADYMRESGVWSRFGLSYWFQKHFEQLQKKHALGLMPVSNNYKNQLVIEGVETRKIRVVPCTVERDSFNFDRDKRNKIRSQYSIDSKAIVGIYVGKFGGNYLSEKAFQIFQWTFSIVEKFHLFILTPNDRSEVIDCLVRYEIPTSKCVVLHVKNSEVPDYLSASDFAYALYKQGLSKKYLSPIKVGEYWANGLPVLIPRGIGDDSQIVEKHDFGATFDMNEHSIKKSISKIVSQIDANERAKFLAKKYRDRKRVKEAYKYFLGKHDHLFD